MIDEKKKDGFNSDTGCVAMFSIIVRDPEGNLKAKTKDVNEE